MTSVSGWLDSGTNRRQKYVEYCWIFGIFSTLFDDCAMFDTRISLNKTEMLPMQSGDGRVA